MNKTSSNYPNEVVCKYDHTKNCNLSPIRSCSSGGYCSSNPTRFLGKPITRGQKNFLISRGYEEEDIQDMTMVQAGDEIARIKLEAPVGTFKTWIDV